MSDTSSNEAQWVQYPYCISICVLTLRRNSAPQLIHPGQSRVLAGLPFLFISLFCGWWGFPFGLIYTPLCIVGVLSGGQVVGGVGIPGTAVASNNGCAQCRSLDVVFALGQTRCRACGHRA